MSSPGREGNGMVEGEMGIWRGGAVQKCTEEGGGDRGRGKERDYFLFLFF